MNTTTAPGADAATDERTMYEAACAKLGIPTNSCVVWNLWQARAAIAAGAPAEPPKPVIAAHDALALIARLESFYAFECEAGPLRNCHEWMELKRFFDVLAAGVPAPRSCQGMLDN